MTDVFAYVADVRTFREWGHGVLDLRHIGGGETGLGATYGYTRRVFGRTVTGTLRVVGHEPDHTFVLEGESGGAPFVSRVTFEAVPGGTRLTEEVTQAAPALLGPLVGVLVGRIVRTDHRTIKRLLERPSPPVSRSANSS